MERKPIILYGLSFEIILLSLIRFYICKLSCTKNINNPDLDVWGSLVTQMVRNLPAMWETQGQSLGQEDPLEKGMATHSWGILGASLVAQMAENLPAIQETQD